MADTKISALVDGGAPQATDEFVIARGGDNFKVDYASLESETLNDAVILAPASSARNVIQPTAGAVIAAIIKAHAAQSVDLTQWQMSDGTVLGSVGKTGELTISPSAISDVALKILDPSPVGDYNTLIHAKTAADETVFYVDGAGELELHVRDSAAVGFAVFDEVGISANQFQISRLGADLFTVGPTGAVTIKPSDAAKARLILSGGTLPASGDFAASQLGLWYDPTDGAAKFMLKGKTADGTVVTWTFPAFTGSTSTFLRADGTFAAPPSGAPTTATYITQTPDAGLSAEQALSALATGIVKNTTTTGVLSIATQGTDYYAPGGTDVAVTDGGTGSSTAAGARTNLDVPSNAEAVLDTLFDANTVLAADTDNTPAALTMGASTILARLAAGNIKAATPSELRTLLDVPTNAEAILDTIVDAKGDLIVATAADTVARLAVGANGKMPVADSAQSSGIRWGGGSSRYAAATVTTPVDVVSTTTETSLISFTVGANDMGTDGILRLVMVGDKLYNNNVADTLRVRVKFGGTTLLDCGPTALFSISAPRKPWRWVLEVANLGATNSQWLDMLGNIAELSANANTGIGAIFGEGTSRRSVTFMTSAAAAAIDTTANQTLAVTVQWSASSANNSFKLIHAYAELIS